MSIVPPRTGRRPLSEQEAIALELVSGLLMIIGLIAFAYLFYSIVTNEEIIEATQGPEIEGVGVEVNKVPPESSFNQDHFQLNVTPGSAAADAGLTDNDVLLKVGSTDIDAASLTADDLKAVLEQEYNTAAANGSEAIEIVVSREGVPSTLNLPLEDYQYLFELRVPLDVSAEEIGLDVTFVRAPHFEIRIIEDGPAEANGLQTGDWLTAIEGTELTPDMPIGQVREMLREEDVELEDEDFVIRLGIARPIDETRFREFERSVPKNVAPSLIIAYLDNFGFVLPFLAIIIGFGLLRLGTRLRRFDLIAARWTLVALMWLSIGLFIGALRNFWVGGKGGLITDEPFNIGDGIAGAIPMLLAIIPLAIAYLWLNRNIHELFTGEETLTSRNTRFAWSLLIPTIAVLVLVAAQPLEQSFIKSLTDDEFSTNRPARFVGFRNYVNLLSFKFTTVECQKEEDNDECARVQGSGSIIWERSDIEEREAQQLRQLPREEREDFIRYQEAFTWRLLGSDTGLRLLGKDPIFLKSVGNTLTFTFFSVVLELILGMIIALVVNSNFRGRGLMRTAMLVPWAIPTVVSAVLWQAIMRPDQTGILNRLLLDVGLIEAPKQWLAANGPWMNAIVAVDVWKTAPFMALLILAGLQTIPGEVYEAAAVDGASKVRQFFSITLPLLRPIIAVALVFRTLDALRAFDVFQVLLDPTRPSMAFYNYDRLVNGQLDGYASAVGVLIFVLIMIFTVTYVRIVRLEQQ